MVFETVSLLLSRRTQGNTKAEADGAARRQVPAAVRRPTKPGGVAPTAATDHAARAFCRPRRVRHWAARVVITPVATPFPDVPVHVVQAESIREFLTDSVGVLLANVISILVEPCVLLQLIGCIAKAVSRFSSSPASVFPLRLRG